MHEDPSSEDVARFSSETGFCPECGAEIWDAAFACPECDAIVEGQVTREQPASSKLSRRTAIILVAVLIMGLLGLLIKFI